MDLLIIFITSVLIVPLVVFTDGTARVVLGLILVLLFPGYALISAIFPRKTDMEILPRLAYSVAVSITLLVIFLLVLDAAPWGIELYPGLIFLVTFTCMTAVIAWWRRCKFDSRERYQPSFKGLTGLSLFWREKSQLDRALTGVLTVVIVGVIGTVGYIAATPLESEKYTEFYLLDLDKKVDYYPDELAPGEEGEVIVGIVNRELEITVYNVEIVLDDEMITEIGPINLEKNETWEQGVAITPTRVGDDQKVEFLLYKDDRQLYRTLHIWIDVSEEAI